MIRLNRIFIILFFFTSLLGAQQSPNAGQAGEIFRYGITARGLALGGAYSFLVDDASASYWNPSLLTNLRNYDFRFTLNNLRFDTKFAAVCGGIYFKKFHMALGCSFMGLYSCGFEWLDEYEDKIGKNFDYNNVAFILSWGWQPNGGNISFGLNFKGNYNTFTSIRLKNSNWSQYGGDIAITYTIFKNGLKCGVIAKNISKYTDFRIGIVTPPVRLNQKIHSAFCFEINPIINRKPEDNENSIIERFSYFLGVEISVSKEFYVRLGYNKDTNGFSIGTGFELQKKLDFDCSFRDKAKYFGTEGSFTFGLHGKNIRAYYHQIPSDVTRKTKIASLDTIFAGKYEKQEKDDNYYLINNFKNDKVDTYNNALLSLAEAEFIDYRNSGEIEHIDSAIVYYEEVWNKQNTQETNHFSFLNIIHFIESLMLKEKYSNALSIYDRCESMNLVDSSWCLECDYDLNHAIILEKLDNFDRAVFYYNKIFTKENKRKRDIYARFCWGIHLMNKEELLRADSVFYKITTLNWAELKELNYPTTFCKVKNNIIVDAHYQRSVCNNKLAEEAEEKKEFEKAAAFKRQVDYQMELLRMYYPNSEYLMELNQE